MKRLFILCLCVFGLLSPSVYAHSTVESSIPEKDTTVASSPDDIQITFNTTIESLSSFKLFNENGEQVELDQIVVKDQKMSAAVLEPMANGQYQVQWSVIGADGHAVKGDYSFVIDVPTPVVTAEPTDSATQTDQPETTPEVTSEASSTPSPASTDGTTESDDGDTNEQSNRTPYLVIGIIIILFGLFIVYKRRRNH